MNKAAAPFLTLAIAFIALGISPIAHFLRLASCSLSSRSRALAGVDASLGAAMPFGGPVRRSPFQPRARCARGTAAECCRPSASRPARRA